MTNEAIEVEDLAATAVPLQILSYINGAYTVNKNLTTLDKSLQSIGLQLTALDSKLQSVNNNLSTIISRLGSVVTAVQSIDKKTT